MSFPTEVTERFEDGLKTATDASEPEPTAFQLATASANGKLSVRTMLLKDFDETGFVFYTNYGSAKASAIAEQPRVSLHFPWNQLDRQVIVGGTARKMSKLESARYFLTRPRESQLAAWASQQSRPISARALLEQQVMAMKEKFGKGEIPLPDFWGGYTVIPDRIEFWQGGAHRLHDRFEYRSRDGGQWTIEQLQP